MIFLLVGLLLINVLIENPVLFRDATSIKAVANSKVFLVVAAGWDLALPCVAGWQYGHGVADLGGIVLVAMICVGLTYLIVKRLGASLWNRS